MLKVHHVFIIIGIVFIILIAITVYNKKPTMESNFENFVRDFSIELEKEGFSKQTIEDYKNQVALSSIIYDINREEVIVTPLKAQKGVLEYYTDSSIIMAQSYFKDNLSLLQNKAKKYNVDEATVVSNMVIASALGGNLGADQMINILTTYYLVDKMQITYLTELKAFLRLVDNNHVIINSAGYLDGTMSYLGITPTMYLLESTDGDNDGVIDLYRNPKDIIDTAFAMLQKNGYKSEEPALTRVSLPIGVNLNGLEGIEYAKTNADWQALGLMKADGTEFDANLFGALYAINSDTGALLYHNYSVILKTNNNVNKSIAIGLLSDDLSTYLQLMNYKTKNVVAKPKPTYRQSIGPKKDDSLGTIYLDTK